MLKIVSEVPISKVRDFRAATASAPQPPQMAQNGGGNYAKTRKSVVDSILFAVSEQTGIDLTLMLSRNRTQPVSDARHMAMGLIKEFFPRMTDAQIGGFLGRGQADVCHGRRAVLRRLDSAPGYRVMFEFVRQSVRLQIPEVESVLSVAPSKS
jgi:hypothetical protein